MINEEDYYKRIKEFNISHYTGEVPYYIQAPLRRAEKKILISIPKGSKILDVGCGSGRFSIGAALAGYDVTGIDITSEAINAASNKAKRIELNNLNFLVGDMTNMPFKDNEFDYVFCPRFSINAVATFQRRQKAIQEMIRVVKLGGIVYIESFNRFYLGKGLSFLLKNIFLDIQKIFTMAFYWIFQKQYTGLLLGDITYRANKVNAAPKGYAHLPTIFELKKLTSAHVPLKFYSIPQIVREGSIDIFKYLRYSIWIFLTKKKS
jgi:ubiquinone/menaquinone biosynthesis C-methylase UbiE